MTNRDDKNRYGENYGASPAITQIWVEAKVIARKIARDLALTQKKPWPITDDTFDLQFEASWAKHGVTDYEEKD